MESRSISRRTFLERTAAGAATALSAGSLGASLGARETTKRTAVDLVPLGKTGLKISRLGLGTGSKAGEVQRDLGREGFNRLIQHGFDRGVRFIDTADMYKTHEMIAEAIRRLPREKIFLQSKVRWEPQFQEEGPQKALERFLRELKTDYLDSLLIHCTTLNTWTDDLKRMREVLTEAKEKQRIRLHGVSCHGLPALRAATLTDWVDVQQARVNPQGRHVDGTFGQWGEPGKPEDAFKECRAMHEQGRGMIGMKIIGDGDFKNAEDREKSIRFAMSCGFLDCVVIGFASTAEMDEAIERMDRALAEAG